MSRKKFQFLDSEFFRNVSYQMFGTGLAQLLPFAATPILTRLYTEQDFATYASFFAIAGILVVGAGGRYQFAIVLPRKSSEALKIFTLSIYITILYSLVLWFIVLLVFRNNSIKSLDDNIHFIPLYVLCFGIWTSISNLSVRKKAFFNNAVAKVLQSVFYVLPAITLGFSNLTSLALVVARVLGTLASLAYLFGKSGIKITYVRVQELKEVAIKYNSYPKYGLIPAALDIASVQGLILILTKFYSTQDLGYFGLTTLVLSAPLGLVGGSFKDVFYQKITSLLKRGDLATAFIFFKRSAYGLLLIGLPICLIIFSWGPDIFSMVFGEKWIRSGVFASLISFSFLIQLVVSPLSSVFNATNKVKVASFWQTLYFITTFSTLGISATVFELNIETLLLVYVIHEIILYATYFILQLWTLKSLTHVRNFRHNNEE